ncbi:uncharacterized protein LOC110239506 [Exaiptasia diaphana]|uniref:Apple domain-containing protein n=1 Tax=Exaiptasia diaphana TaxID=2652724 RepID=A0A913X8Z0_EXADI|nr:uncharacterized protein LOC110239506 [Exaiptasia diaphana]
MTETMIFCAMMIVVNIQVKGETLNGSNEQCKRKMLRIDDSEIHYEQNLGHVIDRVNVISILQCQDVCLRDRLCVGFNYHFCDDGVIDKNCEILSSLGEQQENECVAFKKFDYEQVRNDLLKLCPSDQRYHPSLS